ncbi:RING finger protein nhl-1-like [Anneissia japonica]|uniref:RING finger protein nhl-1-like n=1 Tax=Anneissia japonica TaxID=1529436 RepID=UPI001425B83F|nr:RING finger protein nhl-1-like [Anneissia japonica]XP_033126823.1 RING finger protein nhl-1-like [Anneissia japonica]XP_033126824.1 RING finger protein nhl-1-like [Anneissia japonica]
MGDLLEDILECHICAEKYNLTDRRPKVLNCGHRFCLGCLNLLGQQNHIKCPNCQKVFDIPACGVKSFTDNFTIIDLMEHVNVPPIQGTSAGDCHENITDGVVKLQGLITNFEAELQARNVVAKFDTAEKNIEDSFHKMLQLLERRKHCLLEEFNTIKEKEIRNLDIQNKSISDANKFLTLTQQQLRDGTLKTKSNLQKISAECQRLQDGVSSLKKSEFKFSFLKHGQDDLMNGIASFGCLVKEEKETQKCVTPLTVLAKENVSMVPPEQRYNNADNQLKVLPLSRLDAPFSCSTVNPSAVVEVGRNLLLLDSQQHFIDLLEASRPNVLTYFPIQMPRKDINLFLPCGITVDSENNIVLIDNASMIYIASTSGQYVNSFSILTSGDTFYSNFPNVGLACDGNNDIYTWCSKYKILRVFNKNGVLLRNIAPAHARFAEPFISSICIHDEKIYIADSKVSTIAEYSSQGDLLKTMGKFGVGNGQFKNPEGIVVDKKGLILVADSGNGRIQVLSPEGQFLISFGETALSIPCYVSVFDKGQVAICDRVKQCIMMLE